MTSSWPTKSLQTPIPVQNESGEQSKRGDNCYAPFLSVEAGQTKPAAAGSKVFLNASCFMWIEWILNMLARLVLLVVHGAGRKSTRMANSWRLERKKKSNVIKSNYLIKQNKESIIQLKALSRQTISENESLFFSCVVKRLLRLDMDRKRNQRKIKMQLDIKQENEHGKRIQVGKNEAMTSLSAPIRKKWTGQSGAISDWVSLIRLNHENWLCLYPTRQHW